MSNQRWPLVPLSNVVSPVQRPMAVIPGQSYRTLGVKLWGEGAYERQTIDGGQTVASTLNQVREDDLIINKIWVRHGSVAVVNAKVAGCCGSNEFPTFEFRRNLIHPRWMHWYSKSRDLWKKCDLLSQGTSGKNRIRPEKFMTIEVPLPPLKEQQRIVGRIDSLVEKIDFARELSSHSSAQIKTLFPVSIAKAFSDLSCHIASKRKFDEVAMVARGKFSHRPRNDPRFYGGTIPFIQINNISNSDRYIREYSQTLNEEGLKVSRMFPTGTVVIAITGATLGVTGILNMNACFPDSIVGYIPKTAIVSSEYLHYALEHEKRNAIEQSTQTTQPNINLRILGELRLLVPSQSEQYRIVQHLDAIRSMFDQSMRLKNQMEHELNALLPSILDSAFKGAL